MEIWIDEDNQIYVAGIEDWAEAFEEAHEYLKHTGSWDSFEDSNTVQGLAGGFRAASPRWWDLDYLNEHNLDVVPDFCISTRPKEGWAKVFKVEL